MPSARRVRITTAEIIIEYTDRQQHGCVVSPARIAIYSNGVLRCYVTSFFFWRIKERDERADRGLLNRSTLSTRFITKVISMFSVCESAEHKAQQFLVVRLLPP